MSRAPKDSLSRRASTSSGHWKPTCDVRAWGSTEVFLARRSSAARAARSKSPIREGGDCRDKTQHAAAREEYQARFGEATFLDSRDVFATQSDGLALPRQD